VFRLSVCLSQGIMTSLELSLEVGYEEAAKGRECIEKLTVTQLLKTPHLSSELAKTPLLIPILSQLNPIHTYSIITPL
jgi:hypothetical protein